MRHDYEWMHRISMHDFVKEQNVVYFFALNFNGLYCMRLPSRRLEFLGSVPGEKIYQRDLYGAIAQAGEKLYLAPRNGNKIAVFDLKKREFITFPLRYEAEGLPFKFSRVLPFKGKLYFIPARYRYLVVMDEETGEAEYIDEWIKMLEIPDTYEGLIIGRGAFVRGEYLYMACMEDNILVKLHLVTSAAEQVRIGDGRFGFADMCPDADGKCVWFVQKKRPAILKWNERTKECVVYDKMPSGFTHGEIPFVSVLDNGDRITAVSYHANMSLDLDKASHVLRQAGWDKCGPARPFSRWMAKHYFAKNLDRHSFVAANIDDNTFNLVRDNDMKESVCLWDPFSETALEYAEEKILREKTETGFLETVNYAAGKG